MSPLMFRRMPQPIVTVITETGRTILPADFNTGRGETVTVNMTKEMLARALCETTSSYDDGSHGAQTFNELREAYQELTGQEWTN